MPYIDKEIIKVPQEKCGIIVKVPREKCSFILKVPQEKCIECFKCADF